MPARAAGAPAAEHAPPGASRLARAAAALCLAGALAAFLLPVTNPDLFWHLSAARWMAAQLAWPRADWLSHTLDGRPWADFEWLSQLVFLAAHRLGGMRGLWLLKAGLYSACAGALWRALAAGGLAVLPRAAAVLAWALAVSPANDLRPENFSLLLFILLFGALERRRRSPLREGTRRWVLGCAGVFALWANLHAGFLYGLALLGIYAAVDLAARRGRGLARAALAAAAGALFNPYGFQVYAVPLSHWRELAVLERYIREWQGADILSPWLWPFWAVLAASFAAALGRYLRDRRVPYEHLLALSLFALSGAAHVRTGVYFVSVAVPVAAAALAGWRLPRAAGVGLSAAGVLALWAFFARFVVPPLSRGEIFSPAFVPAGAARFMGRERATLAPLRLFNPWHWGGYLGFKLQPHYRVFVDGRYIFHGLLEPMYAAARSPEAYREFLDGQGISLALLERTEQFLPMPVAREGGGERVLLRPFYLFYLPRERWALVYWDRRSLLFVRRAAAPQAWIEAHEYRFYRPGDLEAAALQVREGLARAEAVAAEAGRQAAESGDAALGQWALRWLAGLEPRP